MFKYKLWWQSSTQIDSFPEYKQAIINHSKEILDPSFSLEVYGVPKGTSDLEFMSFEFLNNRTVFDNIVRAEKMGYNAVALGCVLDPVLHEAREVVNIPVLGFAETSMLIACMFGRKFGIVTYNELMGLKKINQLIRQYGLESRAADVISFEIDLTLLAKSFRDPMKVIDPFLEAAEKAIAKGAEVIIPGCGVLNMLMVENKVNQVKDTGVPILDASGLLMKSAEMMVLLKEKCGMSVSRKGYYKGPPPEKFKLTRELYSTLTLNHINYPENQGFAETKG